MLICNKGTNRVHFGLQSSSKLPGIASLAFPNCKYREA
jgi:hypothetical protein